MIRIRPYMESDEDIVMSWCRDEETFYRWTAGVLGTYPLSKEDFRKTGGLMRFTAIDEQGVAGFFTMRNPKDDPDELRVGFVIISPERRGRGSGKAMLQLALRYAFEVYGAKRVSLGVFEKNLPAYWCYKAAGFAETGEREEYLLGAEVQTAIDLACERA